MRVWWCFVGFSFLYLVHSEIFAFSTNYYNQKRIIQLSLFASLLLVFLSPDFRSRFYSYYFKIAFKSKALLVCTCFFGGISVYFSSQVWLAFIEWVHFLSLFILFLVFSAAKNIDPKGFYISLLCLILSAILYVFKIAVVVVAALYEGMIIKASYMYTGFVNENFAAQFLGIVAAFLVGMFVNYKYRFEALVYYFCITGVVFYCFLVDCRGVIVSFLGVGLLATILLGIKRGMPIFIVVLSTSSVALLLFVLILNFSGSPELKSQAGDVLSSSGRSILWSESWGLISQNPLIGHGPGSFYMVSAQKKFSHPHNIYLQLLVEWGGVVFILLSALFFYCIAITLKKLRENKASAIALGGFLALLEGFIHGGVSGVFIMPVSQTLFVYFAAVLFSQLSSSNRDELSVNGIKLKAIVCSSILIVFVKLASFIWMYPENDNVCIEVQGPRNWAPGGLVLCSQS